jgi:hypothetical protein
MVACRKRLLDWYRLCGMGVAAAVHEKALSSKVLTREGLLGLRLVQDRNVDVV